MSAERSVLIVDRSEETREVLKTALERRGVKILAARGPRRGLELARTQQPDLIVLDLEVSQSPREDVSSPFAYAAEDAQAPLVILGTCRRKAETPPNGEFIAKPYHFAPLIRRIEELLDATGRDRVRSD